MGEIPKIQITEAMIEAAADEIGCYDPEYDTSRGCAIKVLEAALGQRGLIAAIVDSALTKERAATWEQEKRDAARLKAELYNRLNLPE